MEGPRSRSEVRDARAADGARSVISRKELARQLRRQAYQKAKAQRAVDPKHLAMKEAAKVRRREVYQQVKEQRKAAESEQKAKRSALQAEERATTKLTLAKQLASSLKGAALEPGLKSNVRAALDNKRVNELVHRLRLVSEQPGVTANEAYSSSTIDPSSRARHAREGSQD